MKITTKSAASTAAAVARSRPGISDAHTAAGNPAAAPTQIPVNTLLARIAAAAICAPRGVVSGFASSSSLPSLTGETASLGSPALRRNRSRPVIEPKYGGRIRATHSAIVGAKVRTNNKVTRVHIPSHWAGTGHHIRTAATLPPNAHNVTTVAAALT